MADRRAVFYCSASYLIDEKYNQAARDCVRAACFAGYDIVSGGTVKGTMGVVCDEAAKHGAGIIGVIPRFMADVVNPLLTECIWTDKMSERKDCMREGTSIAVALPGGIGTLEELVETLTLAKLGKYKGKVVAYNLDGFWDGLRDLLDHFVSTGMMTAQDRALISFPSTLEDFKQYL